jgi:very-short-patch-repair endonuclease
VTTPRRGHSRPGITLHRATLAPEDRTNRDGIPVTSIPRTLLDFAAVTPSLDAVVHAIEEAERLRLIDVRLIDRLLEGTNGHRGAAKLEHAMAKTDPQAQDTRSHLERTFLALCREGGLQPPLVNTLIEGYLVDFVWPKQRLIVELDGYGYHSTRRAFEKDRERDAVLQMARYRVVRVTARRLAAEPGAILVMMGRLLAG